MFKHYNIATVMIDSTILDNLKFLYEITIISKDHSFIRFHRRNPKHRYNYRYSIKELIPWIDKVKEIAAKTNTLRITSIIIMVVKQLLMHYNSKIC